MGIGPFRSSSYCGCSSVPTTSRPDSPPGNPDPTNFKIVAIEQLGRWIIATIEYPDCSNYEGRKILVFSDVDEEQLRRQDTLDPHFCDEQHLSPVARFEPTERGLSLARKLVAMVVLA